MAHLKRIKVYFLILSCVLISNNDVRAADSVTNVLCENDSGLCVCEPVEDDTYFLNIDCSFRGSSILRTEHRLPFSVLKLDLSQNNLTHVNVSNFLHSKYMSILKLNRNSIVNITVDAFDLPSLHELDLSENRLEYLNPEVFSKLKKLKYLNLAMNRFTRFATMLFHHLGNLEALSLDRNGVGAQLRNYSMFRRNGLALTAKIRSLSLNRVDLIKAPDNFLADAYDLRALRIAGNNLSEICELPFTLQYLDISDNPIARIDADDFSNLPMLRELKLNNLSITEISEYTFAPLKALTRLALESNAKLVRFDRYAFGREVLDDPDDFVLEELSLRGSRLTSLSEDLIAPFGQLMKLDLQGNTWHCDCELAWIKQLKIPVKDRDHVRCYTPRSLYNSKVFELEDEYYTCRGSDTPRVFMALGAAVCLALTAVAVTLFTVAGRPWRAASPSEVSCSYVKIDSNAEKTNADTHILNFRVP